MNLTSENVVKVFRLCLFKEDESRDNAVKVEGIVADFGFHPDRLDENRDNIVSMLNELPDEFKEEGGGGWSFLNACNDKSCKQWTELHSVMEYLICLGIAIDRAMYVMPRETWDIFPGGVPYIVITQEKGDENESKLQD